MVRKESRQHDEILKGNNQFRKYLYPQLELDGKPKKKQQRNLVLLTTEVWVKNLVMCRNPERKSVSIHILFKTCSSMRTNWEHVFPNPVRIHLAGWSLCSTLPCWRLVFSLHLLSLLKYIPPRTRSQTPVSSLCIGLFTEWCYVGLFLLSQVVGGYVAFKFTWRNRFVTLAVVSQFWSMQFDLCICIFVGLIRNLIPLLKQKSDSWLHRWIQCSGCVKVHLYWN